MFCWRRESHCPHLVSCNSQSYRYRLPTTLDATHAENADSHGVFLSYKRCSELYSTRHDS